MKLQPEDGESSDPIAWVRGTCPRCGSGAVLHHVIGMPVPEAYESSPPWVSWEGCCGMGPELECLTCDHAWNSSDVGFAEEGEPTMDLYDVLTPAAPPPLRTVGAVITDGDRVLVLRHWQEAYAWEFPGGEIAPGESPQEALARVLREDFGMSAEVGWLIGREVQVEDERRYEMDCYWVRIDGPPAPPPSQGEWVWRPRSDFLEREDPIAFGPVRRKIVLGAEPIFRR